MTLLVMVKLSDGTISYEGVINRERMGGKKYEIFMLWDKVLDIIKKKGIEKISGGTIEETIEETKKENTEDA